MRSIVMNRPIKKYDKDKNLIYHRDKYGNEQWWEYKDGNNTYHKDSEGHEFLMDYNDHGDMIHREIKDEYGYDEWWDFNDEGIIIHYKNSEGLESSYNNRGDVTYRRQYGIKQWWDYDDDGDLVHYKDNDGREEWYGNKELTLEFKAHPYPVTDSQVNAYGAKVLKYLDNSK